MRPPQLIPGHEAIGKVVEVGKNVKDFQSGDRVVADVGISVGLHFCAPSCRGILVPPLTPA